MPKMQLSEESKERLSKILDISRVTLHYGWMLVKPTKAAPPIPTFADFAQVLLSYTWAGRGVNLDRHS